MTNVRNMFPIVAATALLMSPCLAQQVRITSVDADRRLAFALSPTGAVTDYSCTAEWCPTLTGAWTNDWHQPFSPFSRSNGMSYASLPRFFRIACAAGIGQSTNAPAWRTYTVTGVMSARISDGLICWTNSGDTGLVYHIEHATGTNGDWLGHWACQTNIHTTTAATNAFSLPMRFRVVTIKPNDGGENPW